MQIWNSGELLLVLGVIVLSLENSFERLQMIIVLMKQMWKTAYQTDTVKKEQDTVKKEHQRLTNRDGGVCILVCSLSLFLEVQALCRLSSKFGNLT